MACLPLIYVIATILLRAVSAVPLQFYSFGRDYGDELLESSDDGSTEEIQLTVSFPFFDRDHDSLFVNNNGIISFTRSVSKYTPDPFPLESNFELIAPYWSDVDTRGIGEVWYRETANPDLLERAQREISKAFVALEIFTPTYLFISTWDHVGYYNSHTDKTNTFQCVMVTNGLNSFVIFHYADNGIQWTTGDASDGSGGLGGHPAQVGFNAGDTIRAATVNGSRTPDIINIHMTSNVGVPGVWIYRVDPVNVELGGCSTDKEVAISPRFGIFLGGQPVKVHGPCFESSSDIRCLFDDIEVRGIYLNKLQALCISPMISHFGSVHFSLMVDGDLYGDTQFTSLIQSQGHSIDVISDTLVFSYQSKVTLQWDPDTVFSQLVATDYTVDISVYEFNTETNVWKEVSILVMATDNDGEEEVTFPNIFVEGSIAPIAIFVSVTKSISSTIQEALTLYDLKPGKWSAEFYYAETLVLERRSNRLCTAWYLSEPEDIGNEILSTVTACPPTEEQASRLCNSGVVIERHFSIFGNSIYDRQRREYFHPDAAICYKQPILNSLTTDGKGQRCCYNEEGNLLTGPPNGGSVELWSEEINPASHYRADVEPYLVCCKGNLPNCESYYMRRPSDNGSQFDPAPCGWMIGDPHIVTLDGLKYTFNGHGEFYLVQSTQDINLTIQGRMVPILNSNGTSTAATAFSAIVAKQEDSDTVQFELSRRGVDVFINGELIVLSELNERKFQNLYVFNEGNSIYSAIFSSGVSIKLAETNAIISSVKIVLPSSFKQKINGLMGNYNGDTSDDLQPQSSNSSIPVNSTIEEVHTKFGMTWIVNQANDSIFYYGPGKEWSEYYRPYFTPIYSANISSTLADAVCGDDLFCRFDFIVTGRTDIANSTLEESHNVELVSNLSYPVLCAPVCGNGVCIANDTCACSTGFTGDFCTHKVYSECHNNQCINGGTCLNHAGTYSCLCVPGFIGTLCENASNVVDTNRSDDMLLITGVSVASVITIMLILGGMATATCIIVYKRKRSPKCESVDDEERLNNDQIATKYNESIFLDAIQY